MSFQNVALKLFKVMKLPDFLKEAPGYTVTFSDNLPIKIFGMQEEYINMVSEVGIVLAKIGSDELLNLLYANQFNDVTPQITLGINPNSRHVVLWTREILNKLREEKEVIQFFERFTNIAMMVQQ
jgi:hypothetical protein